MDFEFDDYEQSLEPEIDDTVHFCPDCERPNQFGELCVECERERDIALRYAQRERAGDRLERSLCQS